MIPTLIVMMIYNDFNDGAYVDNVNVYNDDDDNGNANDDDKDHGN